MLSPTIPTLTKKVGPVYPEPINPATHVGVHAALVRHSQPPAHLSHAQALCNNGGQDFTGVLSLAHGGSVTHAGLVPSVSTNFDTPPKNGPTTVAPFRAWRHRALGRRSGSTTGFAQTRKDSDLFDRDSKGPARSLDGDPRLARVQVFQFQLTLSLAVFQLRQEPRL